ncbi:MAG: DNA recombination protein RmuC [Bdellovibrionales bacterium]|nr:DNA recombination protein RmuC [Bdellovibrionales bacterium]
MEIALGLLSGVVASAGLFWFLSRKKSDQPQTNLAEVQFLKDQLAKSEDQLFDSRTQISELQKSLGTAEAQNAHLQERLANQKQELEKLQAQFAHQFENLASKIFQNNLNQFRESSEKNLGLILNPLRDRLQEFQKKVEDSYSSEARERFALKGEIEKIILANEKMTREASQLTQALKGDVKIQGNWGEMILERILEVSGLREGIEYRRQAEGMGLKDENGRDQRPDVVILLPDQKHLIVDSKVSLLHYERWVREESLEAKAESAKLFLASIRAHVDGLSKKRYQDLEGLGTPDLVMMFVPIEGAFSAALQLDSELYAWAWSKSIVLVSPTTLLATLRTVASVWKQENQTKNALEIARQAGALYDKFVGFTEDLVLVEQKLDQAKGAYDQAVQKLSTGKGNLVSRVEGLRKLGARATKQLPAQVLESKGKGEGSTDSSESETPTLLPPSGASEQLRLDV